MNEIFEVYGKLDAGEKDYFVKPLDGETKNTLTYARTPEIARNRFVLFRGVIGDRYEVYSEWKDDEEHRERKLVGRGVVGVGYSEIK